jgi:hypothetical protein
MNSNSSTQKKRPAANMPQGYQRLASIMARDRSLAIFRRFDDVLLLSLLSLQAEILEKCQLFRRQCELDESSKDPQRMDYSKYFLALHNSKSSNGAQLDLLIDLRTKLKEYSEFLPVLGLFDC